MAKRRDETEAERAERKAHRRADKLHEKVDNGGVKKGKKEKKEPKSSKAGELMKAANEEVKDIEATINGEEKKRKRKTKDEDDGETKINKDSIEDEKPNERPPMRLQTPRPVGPLVPFADPLADQELTESLFASIALATKYKCAKRGVKEVNKAVRMYPKTSADAPRAVCIIAGDISPMDVISHIPVSCEYHFIPYVFVRSRAQLGRAGYTTRPTSAILVCAQTKQLEGMSEKEKGAWAKEYKHLCKRVANLKRKFPIF